MKDPSLVRVGGPLGSYAAGFQGWLEGQGYRPGVIGSHLRLMGHFSGWLAAGKLDGSAVTPAVADSFVAHRRRAGSGELRSRRGLAPLLEYLRQQRVVPMPEPASPRSPVEVLLSAYARYSAQQGLAPSTFDRNVILVRPFLEQFAAADGLELGRLDVESITVFVLECRSTNGRTAPRILTALRSLLRFLHVEGLIDRPLVNAVPAIASWKLAGLPKTLRPDDVAALLATCDKQTVVGRRDLAILTVLARLGLRAGEVAALRLDDIDWRRGQLTLRGKGNRLDELPLPADVGQVIVAYLHADHPVTTPEFRELFGRVRAPRGPLNRLAVTRIVARAARRAGLPTIHAHRLRHTAAGGMLRSGGSLTEIGQVLRHTRPLTTAIYAKVDVEALRNLALPWPGDAV